MSRRKGVPCGCDADPCGCSPKNHCVKKINNQSPDPNGEFTIVAGTNIDINPAGNGIRIDVTGIDALQYKGTVGAGGTIPNLPPASDANKGWIYIAVSAATTPVTYEIGDTVISTGLTWSVIPSGNDPVSWSQIIGKPTTLGGYGITDAVDDSSSQTVGGAKTWTGQQIATGQRAYDPANVDDVATIGTLDAYTPMVRTSGNQEVLGQKTIENLIIGKTFDNKCTVTLFDTDTSKYCRMYTYNNSTGAQYKTFMVMITPKRLNINRTGLLYFGDNRNTTPTIGWLLKGSDIANTDFVITKEADGTINLWCKTYTGSADGYHGIRILEHTTSNLSAGYLETVVNEEGYTISPTGYTDSNGVVHTFTSYVTPS